MGLLCPSCNRTLHNPGRGPLDDYQWEGLFDIKYDLLLYDITSTYFEGKMKGNPQAQRGHSRDHRPDCKQVCIGLVVTRDGMPLGYEVFPGNLHDSKTVKATVEKIESRYGKADRVWVMDRGMVSEATLTWMREGGRRYLVGLPKSELKKHAAELADPAGWKVVRDGVAVRYAQAATDETGASGDLLLLCRSDDRREKETAMLELFSTRIEIALVRLQRRCENARKPLSLEKIQRQVGRLLQRNQRAAKTFAIRIEAGSEAPSGVRVEWSRDEAVQKLKEHSHGCYALRTNVHDWTEEEVWKDVHPADSGGGGVSCAQDGTRDPSHPSSAGRSGPGAHLRLLPGIRSLEISGAMAESSGPGEFAADDLGRAWPNSERRHHAADDDWRENSTAKHREPGEGATVHSTAAGDRSAETDANSGTSGVSNVVPTLETRSRKLQRYSVLTAEVGLGRRPYERLKSGGHRRLSFKRVSVRFIFSQTNTLEDQGHGTFTYYFLKGLSGDAKDASGRVTTEALYDYLKPKVQDAARRQNRDQEPVLHGQGDRELVRF